MNPVDGPFQISPQSGANRTADGAIRFQRQGQIAILIAVLIQIKLQQPENDAACQLAGVG
jgi:hypothetical protein